MGGMPRGMVRPVPAAERAQHASLTENIGRHGAGRKHRERVPRSCATVVRGAFIGDAGSSPYGPVSAPPRTGEETNFVLAIRQKLGYVDDNRLRPFGEVLQA
jgi:hypothetical protein